MSTLTLNYTFDSDALGWSFSGTGSGAWASGAGDPGGALQSTGSGTWSISGTWETFGVPAGSVVGSVQVTNLDDSLSGGSGTVGPVDLVDTGTSTSYQLLASTPASPGPWTTGLSGSSVSVPAGLQASTSPVEFTVAASSGPDTLDLDNLSIVVTYSAGGTTATTAAPSPPSAERWGAASATAGASLAPPAIPRGESWGAAAVGRSTQANAPRINTGESWALAATSASATLAAPALPAGERWNVAPATASRAIVCPPAPTGESWGGVRTLVPASLRCPATPRGESWGASISLGSTALGCPTLPRGESWGPLASSATATASAPSAPSGESWHAAAAFQSHPVGAPAVPVGESWGASTTETIVGILYSDLFGTKLGPLIATANQVNAFRGKTIPDRVAAHVADYAGSDASLAADLWSALASYQSGGAALLSALQALFRATVVQDVGAAIALPDQSLATAMAALVADMKSNAQTVAASSVGGSATAAAGNVGDAVVRIGTLSKSGLAQENLLAESIAATVIADAQSGGATAGREVVRYQGQPAASGGNLSYSWPAGSGASTSVACVSASAIRVGGLQNWLANSDFETWSGTPAAPSSWSIGVGAAGTQITRATTAGTYYSGTSALALAGDGSTLTAISQPLGATPTTALAPLDQLAWNAWVRTSGSPASGTLEIALVDGSGNVLDDAQGHPASSSFAASSLGSSFAAIGGFLRTPRVLPAAASLRIRLSAPLPVGSTLYLDRLALARAAELYAGGPCLAAFSGATNLIKGDAYSVATTNDRHGLFQSGFDMMANLKGLGLLLPSTSGTPTIPNSWVA